MTACWAKLADHADEPTVIAATSPVHLSERVPAGWAHRIDLPCQSEGFAEAMRTMGYEPRYLWSDARGALALVRGVFPVVGRFTARANLFAPSQDAGFVVDALEVLGRQRIPSVKVGDTMWGLAWSELPTGWPFPRTRVTPRHTFTLDLTLDVDALLKRQEPATRTRVRKADRDGVQVREVTSDAHLGVYCALAGETTSRVRKVTAYTDFPAAFFEAIYEHMVPAGTARMYLAWHGETPLAGCIVLCGSGVGLYFAGASTRDPALIALQGPTAMLWHAMLDLKQRGLTRFDFGGCTPTDDPKDPRHGVYSFKKRWGGQLETFSTLEVILGPWRHAMQERVMAPVWDRMHPLYFRLGERLRRLSSSRSG